MRGPKGAAKALAALALASSVVLTPVVAANTEPALPSARQVMALFDAVIDGDAAGAELVMLLVDRNGQKKRRELSWRRLDQGADSRSSIVFSAPADLKGTGFVGWNWSGDQPDDTWLCLPALQRCKRVANEGQSGAFLGTDFSFYDINGFNLGDWDYQFVDRDEMLNGEPVWVVEAVPAGRNPTAVQDKTGYRKFYAWISKNTHLMIKARYWLTRPHREKYFFAKDVRRVDGIWTIYQQQMLSMERGAQVHGTVIQLQDIDYGVSLDPAELSTSGLMQSW